MKLRRLIGCVAVFFILAASLLPDFALAQTEGINLQVSPLPIELSTPPGTSASADLRVRNGSSQTEKLAVHLLKVTEDDNGVVSLSSPSPNDDWAKWVSFDRTVFDAPSNQWQTIHMTINVPKSAAFGYYFAVEYTRANEQAPQPGHAVARGAVATFVLLNAEAPGAVRSAQVVSFTADRKSYEFLPATFTVKIRATGNVHVAPAGNVFILKGKKQIDVLTINAAQGNILPHSSRLFSTSWSDGFPVYETKYNGDQPVVDKNGKPVQSLKWDFSKANRLRFGKYTAHLVMLYYDGQRDVSLEATVSFWVVPWRLLIGIILIAAFVFVGVWSTFRKSARFVKKHTKKDRG